MKVLIIGAGVIGTIYGWALAKTGHQVVHLVRPGRNKKLENGIVMDMYDRRDGKNRFTKDLYKPETIESPGQMDDYEMIIIPVRHYVIEETLKEILPFYPHSMFY